MFLVEPLEYAPEFLKKFVAKNFPNENITTVGIARVYDRTSEYAKKSPAFRDRTNELQSMVAGLANLQGVFTWGAEYSDYFSIAYRCTKKVLGRDLYKEYGFDAAGAQFIQEYLIVAA